MQTSLLILSLFWWILLSDCALGMASINMKITGYYKPSKLRFLFESHEYFGGFCSAWWSNWCKKCVSSCLLWSCCAGRFCIWIILHSSRFTRSKMRIGMMDSDFCFFNWLLVLQMSAQYQRNCRWIDCTILLSLDIWLQRLCVLMNLLIALLTTTYDVIHI